ncbi:hypothetical protein [Polyangium mundeleinium]|uniref:Lipoprotein n=1 Tax=Polyangium mundeleinium TaxID=2995306 RepID=A0ABT5EHS8_9BACT|nr:hypothetical protein [Polyangium mundeleinium]MDC0741362.1 hypothetical protein [Polyangium mundeleinium]
MHARTRVLLACLLFTSLATFGCSESNSGGSGGAGGSGGTGGAGGSGGGPDCADFSGTFVVGEVLSCSAGIGVMLKGACVAQNSCALTVSTNMGVLTGTVEGPTATLSGVLHHVTTTKFPYECTAKLEKNGSLMLDCSYMTDESAGSCSIALPEQALPAGATSACCDLMGQTCGAGKECTMVDPAGQKTSYFSVCEAAGGAVAEGATCTRTAFGEDNCAPGLLCTDDAKPASSFACRSFCTKSTDCSANELCLAYPYASPLGGLCIPTCAPFGNGCEAGATCRDRTVLDKDGIVDFSSTTGGFACGHAGAVAVGDVCAKDADCGVNARCGVAWSTGDRRCLAYCDAAHPCTGDATCSTYGIPGHPEFGVCQ